MGRIGDDAINVSAALGQGALKPEIRNQREHGRNDVAMHGDLHFPGDLFIRHKISVKARSATVFSSWLRPSLTEVVLESCRDLEQAQRFAGPAGVANSIEEPAMFGRFHAQVDLVRIPAADNARRRVNLQRFQPPTLAYTLSATSVRIR
jgi:hypothetical protein